MPDAPTLQPPKKTVWFWNSHRFWAAVSAAGAGLATVTPQAAALHPIAGIVCKTLGIVCTVVGAVGVAYFIKTSDRTMTLRRSNGNSQ